MSHLWRVAVYEHGRRVRWAEMPRFGEALRLWWRHLRPVLGEFATLTYLHLKRP